MEVEPRCDYCDETEEQSLIGDWNGETGCHYSCEDTRGIERVGAESGERWWGIGAQDGDTAWKGDGKGGPFLIVAGVTGERWAQALRGGNDMRVRAFRKMAPFTAAYAEANHRTGAMFGERAYGCPEEWTQKGAQE